jgi:multisubunit Na+/H+ antiporter MnhG subunit
MNHLALLGLVILGVLLVLGGVILAFTGNEGPEWVGKAVAIVVGALITLAGGSQMLHRES